MTRTVLTVLLASMLISGCRSTDAPTTILNGVITDRTYRPIPNASVRVEAPALFGLINEPAGVVAFSPDNDGMFAVGNLPAGEYRVTVSAAGYRDQTRMVEMRPPAPATVEFTLDAVAY